MQSAMVMGGQRQRFRREARQCKLARAMQSIRTAAAAGATIGLTGFFSGAVAVATVFGEHAPDRLLNAWSNSVLSTTGIRTVCEGLEHLPQRTFVMAMNHQSHFDAVVMFRYLKLHLRFVAKAELRKVPLFGFALARAGNIFVERTGSATDREKLHEAVRSVQERVSVAFFAEGTRSEDGVLRPFKKGAAVMAIEAQVPLVPAAIAGTHRILRKGSLHVFAHPAAFVIGPPISTAGLTVDDRDVLTDRAHTEVARLLARGDELVQELER